MQEGESLVMKTVEASRAEGADAMRQPSGWLAARIAFVYAAVGALWIVCSGWALHRFVQNHDMEARFEVFKGWAFVGVTAVLLGLILSRYFRVIRRSGRMLEDSERCWRQALEGAAQAPWDWNIATNEVFYSAAWKTMLGFGESEIGGSFAEWESRVHPDDLPGVWAVLTPHLRGDTPAYSSEHRMRCKDGRYKWILDQGKVTSRAPDGRALRMSGTHSDIDRRRLEEERSRIEHDLMQELAAAEDLGAGLRLCVSAAIEASGLDCGGVYLVDEESGDLHFKVSQGLSEEFVRSALHYDRGSDHVRLVMAGRPVYKQFADMGLDLSAGEAGEGLRFLAVIPLLHEKRVIGCLNVASRRLDDISPAARVAIETIAAGAAQAIARLRAEEEQRNSDANFRAFFAAIDDAIVVADADGRILFGNTALMDKLGFSEQELAAMRVVELHAPDDRAEARQILAAMLRGECRTCPLPLVRKDGSSMPVETRVWLGRWNGKPCLFGVSKDLTGEREAHLRFERLFRRNPLPMALSSVPDGRFADVNDAWLETFGYDRDEVIGRTDRELDLFPAPEQARPVVAQLLEAGTVSGAELDFRAKSGAILTGLISGDILRFQDGACAVTAMHDITGRRRAERLQALSLEVLRILNDPRTLPEATKLILDVIQRETGIEAVGIRLRCGDDFPYAAACGFPSGFIQAENSLLVRKPEREFCLDERGKPRLECTCGLVLSGGVDPANPLFTSGGSAWTNDAGSLPAKPEEADPRLHPRNRCIHEGYQSVALVPIRVEGDIVGLLQLNDRRKGCFTPEMIRYFEGLTESFGVALRRHKEEQAVRESQRTLRSLFDAIPESLLLMGVDGTILEANSAFAERIGTRVEECVGRSLLGLVPGQLAASRRAWIDEVVQTGAVVVNEEPWGKRWLRHNYCPVRGEDGRIGRVVALGVDITERRAAEEALRVSEARFRGLFENISSGVAVYEAADDGRDFIFRDFNAGGERMDQVARDRVIGRRVTEVFPGVASMGMLDVMRRVWKTGTGEQHPVSRYADGRIAGWRENRVYRLASGEVVAVYEDITDRKKAEEALHDSERRFRALFEQAAVGVAEVDSATGRFLRVNRRYCDLTGYGEEEMLGLDFQTLTHPDDLAADLGQMEQMKAGAIREFSMEKRYRCKDSSLVWVALSVSPLWPPGAAPTKHVAVVQDITSRKRAEQALRDREYQLRSVLDSNPSIIFVKDRDSRILLANAALARFYGTSIEVITGVLQSELHAGLGMPADEIAGWLADDREVIDTGCTRTVDERSTWKDGSVHWYRTMKLRTALPDGRCGVLVVSEEITARRRLEEERESALIKYRTLFDSFPLGITVADRDNRIVESNRAAERILGISEAEQRRRSIDGPEWELVRRDGSPMPPEEFASVRALREGSLVESVEMGIVRSPGAITWISVTAVPVALPDAGLVITYTDISGRVQAEAALAAESTRRRILIDGSKDGIVVLDEQGGVFECNPRFAEMLGCSPEEVRRMHVWDWDCDWTREQVLQAIREIGPAGAHFETRHRRRDGTILDVDLSNSVAELGGQRLVFCVCRDVTARKRLEEQLRQVQKLEAVGQLAGGVAHDFNNILGVFMMHLGALQMKPAPDEEFRTALAEMAAEAGRAATLTRQLLMFSRRSALAVRPLDLNGVIENLLKMLRRLIGEQVDLQFHGEAGLPAVEADAGMIEQVVVNLVVNARDAMPKGGTITIGLRAVELSVQDVTGYPGRRPGRFACLAVSDTGCGMDEATALRIFEPFFTTKEIGVGTGLGLATVHGIVAQHNGWVEVDSAVGRGSTFRVCLPVAAEAPAPAATSGKAAPIERGSETILLVEDERAVRSVTSRMLRMLGYRVFDAGNGIETLALWEKHGAEVDLLLTDMVMPEGMTGLELGEKLQALKPSLKVILVSGYSAAIARAGIPARTGILYLAKPYDTATLARTIRACLGEGG